MAHEHRLLAVTLLSTLISQPANGPRLALALARLLPQALVLQLRDSTPEAFLAALGRTAESPELVWSPQAAVALGRKLATLAADVEARIQRHLAAAQRLGPRDPSSSPGAHGSTFEWALPTAGAQAESASRADVLAQPLSGQGGAGLSHSVDEGATHGSEGLPVSTPGSGPEEREVQVGGVYVRLFLKDPRYPLRNPRGFLEHLLDAYCSATASTTVSAAASGSSGTAGGSSGGEPEGAPELVATLAAALVALLRVHPGLGDFAAQLGYAPKLLQALASDAVVQSVPVARGERGALGMEAGGGGEEGSEERAVQERERVRLCCLMVLHQLALNGPMAEALSNTGPTGPQVCPSPLGPRYAHPRRDCMGSQP